MKAVFPWKKKGLSSPYNREFLQSYTTSRDGITCPGECRSQSHCWKRYFPVTRAHLVVHFGFEMPNEFTRNTFPFRFTIPPASLDPSGSSARTLPISWWWYAEPAVPAFELTCSIICQPHLSATYHLHLHLPRVAGKAAKTVWLKDL